MLADLKVNELIVYNHLQGLWCAFVRKLTECVNKHLQGCSVLKLTDCVDAHLQALCTLPVLFSTVLISTYWACDVLYPFCSQVNRLLMGIYRVCCVLYPFCSEVKRPELMSIYSYRACVLNLFCSQVNCVDKHLLDLWRFVFSFVLLTDSLQVLTGLEVRFSPFCCQLIVFTDTGLEVMRFFPFCCQLIVFTDTGPPSEHHFPPNSARFGNATEGHSLREAVQRRGHRLPKGPGTNMTAEAA